MYAVFSLTTILAFLGICFSIVYLAINSKNTIVAQRAKATPPFLQIIWIIATSFFGNHSILSIKILFNLLCIIGTIMGIVYMKDGRKIGFYTIVTSALLHISNSFLTTFDDEYIITIIIVDALLLFLLTLILFLKNKKGVKLFQLMSPYTEPSLSTTLLRLFNKLSIVIFIAIMFIVPTYRSLHDDVQYLDTYFNEYDFYDTQGNYDYYKYLSIFNHIEKEKYEIKKIGGNYYHAKPKDPNKIETSPSSADNPTSKQFEKQSIDSVKTEMNGADLFEKYNSAVFMVFTTNGLTSGQGSGFFISEDGLAVSNYHVFKGSVIGYETIRLIDGSEYQIKEVTAKNELEDIIIFSVDASNKSFNYIPIAQEEPNIGERCYAIGSPKGFENTFTSGEISQKRNNNLFQISVPIDHGSSGGVLLNSKGEAIGITCGGVDTSGANLNFAINIKIIKKYLKQEHELF